MKSAEEVQRETAEVIGKAVGEVAQRAIQPELAPFKDALDSLAGRMEGHVEELEDQAREGKRAVEAVNSWLAEATSVGTQHAKEAQDRATALHERLDALTKELAIAADTEAGRVRSFEELRTEIGAWTEQSGQQGVRLNAMLRVAEGLVAAIRRDASEFVVFRNDLTVKVDERSAEVLSILNAARNEASSASAALHSQDHKTLPDVLNTVQGELSQFRIDTAEKLGQLRNDVLERSTNEAGRVLTRIQETEAGLTQKATDDLEAAETRLKAIQDAVGHLAAQVHAVRGEQERGLAVVERADGRVIRLALANLLILAIGLAAAAVWIGTR